MDKEKLKEAVVESVKDINKVLYNWQTIKNLPMAHKDYTNVKSLTRTILCKNLRPEIGYSSMSSIRFNAVINDKDDTSPFLEKLKVSDIHWRLKKEADALNEVLSSINYLELKHKIDENEIVISSGSYNFDFNKLNNFKF